MTSPLKSAEDRQMLALIQQLGSRDARTREDASFALHGLGPQIEPFLIAYLDKDMSRNLLRTFQRWGIGLLFGTVTITVLYYCCPHIPLVSGLVRRYHIELVFLCGAVADAGSTMTLRQQGIVQLLTQSTQPFVIEPLLKYRLMMEPPLKEETKTALIRLMPLFDAQEIKGMDAERRRKFFASCYRALKDRNAVFVTTMIDTLGRVGDSDAIWSIQQAAKRNDPQIQGSAMIAIDKIRERIFVPH